MIYPDYRNGEISLISLSIIAYNTSTIIQYLENIKYSNIKTGLWVLGNFWLLQIDPLSNLDTIEVVSKFSECRNSLNVVPRHRSTFPLEIICFSKKLTYKQTHNTFYSKRKVSVDTLSQRFSVYQEEKKFFLITGKENNKCLIIMYGQSDFILW